MTENKINTGFFTNPDKPKDLTKIPGKKELLKKKASPKKYGCDECGRCSHSLIKIRDYDNDVQAVYNDKGKVTTKEKLAYKMVEKGGQGAIGIYGQGEKKILIVADEVSEGGVSAGKPIIGQEAKLMKRALREVGIDMERDCWVVNAVRMTGDPKKVGIASKCCRNMLHADIERLKPKVVITLGFRPLSTLWGDKLSITKDWDRWVAVDRNTAIPDMQFKGTWFIPMFGTRDYIWILNNQLQKAKQWAKDAMKKEGKVPRYLAQKIDPSVKLIDKPTLQNDEYKLKWRWFIRDLKSAVYHLDKEPPMSDDMDTIECLTDKKEIYEAIQHFKKQKIVSCDVETSTIVPHRPKAEIICISFSNIKRTVSFMTRDPEVIEWTKDLLTTRTVQYIFHNASFEIKQFKLLWGIMVDNLFIDSQILCHCFDSRGSTSSLKRNAFYYAGVANYEDTVARFFKAIKSDKDTIYHKSNQEYNRIPEALERGYLYEKGLLFPLEGDTEEIISENKRRNKLLKEGVLSEHDTLLYCGGDTMLTCKVVNAIKPRLMDKREWEAVLFYSKSTITLAKISMNGVKVDRKKLLENIGILDGEAEEMHKAILESEEVKAWTTYIKAEIAKVEASEGTGKAKKVRDLEAKLIINYDSGAQLGKLLFDILKVPGGKKTEGGGWATNEAILETIDNDICKTILNRRKLIKAKNTYLGGILKELNDDDIAMCSYSLALVVSFRSSCGSFSFQNQIKHDERMAMMIRECIMPHEGQQFCEGDYSSCEAYAASIVSGDKIYFKYNTEKSADIHKFVAFTLFNLESDELKPITYQGVEHKPTKKLFKKLRQISKKYTFASSYGGGFYNIATDIWESLVTLDEEEQMWLQAQLATVNISTLEAFRERVKFVDETVWGPTMFGKYGEFKKEQYNTYKKQGYLRNECGFVYRDMLSSMACANYPIQSIAFMKLMRALNLLQDSIEKLELKSKIVGEIHDSITLSIEPSEMDIVKKLLVDSMIHGTNGVPMFSWVNMEFKVDLDQYESSWGSKCDTVRLDPNMQTQNYITA